MAIWQFYFEIKPIRKIDNIEKIISTKFPRGEHWSKDVLLFGDIEKTCIEIIDDEINIRIDLRNISKKDLYDIDEIIKSISNKIIYLDKEYEYSLDVLLLLIKESPELKFCQNPYEFLKEFKK